jgi:hypothetical protein
MTLYLAGNLLGRLVVSYLIVWIVMLFVARFDWRAAFRRSIRWYGILATLALFLLGVLTAKSAGGLG